MSQQPPTGPAGTPGPSDDGTPHTPGAPDEAGGEGFARSPYDAPDTQPLDATTPAYGQAPDPGRTIYSGASTTDPEPQTDGGGARPRWVLPVVIAVIVLLVAGAVAAALLLGGDDDDPAAPATSTPTAEQTTDAEESPAPTETEEPTGSATEPEETEEPTEEPTEAPTSELLEDLDESVTVGELTFELSEDGFTPDENLQRAQEAYRGTYTSGDEDIQMRATLWPDNESADAFAAEMVEAVEGEEVETGSTYTNDTGTFWAFLLEDGRGSYIWTTDRGHAVQVTGSTDYVGGFYTAFPL